jgi:predicted aminopeptidase
MIRKILLALLLLVIILVAWNWSLVVYGLRQGLGQVKIVLYARPVAEALNDPAFPDSLKAKLRMIEEIRKYAIDSLDLKDTRNYKTVYDQRGEEVMWVVTACEPFQLKPKLWEFPVVGTVPYKGYFDKAKAFAERDALEREGWDVSVRNPDGWSTLGWFTDPILTGMLDRPEGDLASLIIHEMVHATLWVKDSVDFNENLASFIGDTAVYKFLSDKFGKESKEYLTYLHQDQDYRRVSKHMLHAALGLDSLYHTMKESDPKEVKLKKKEEYIRHIVLAIETLSLHQPPRAAKRFAKRLPNNTYFMAFRHYQSKVAHFKEEMNQKFRGNLRGYLHYLAAKYPL